MRKNRQVNETLEIKASENEIGEDIDSVGLGALGRLICVTSQLYLSSATASTNKTPPLRASCKKTTTLPLQTCNSYV